MLLYKKLLLMTFGATLILNNVRVVYKRLGSVELG